MDLRQYLDALCAIGELQEVNAELELDLEIGAIARRLYETGGPAALFNRVCGIEPGFRVLAAPAGVGNPDCIWDALHSHSAWKQTPPARQS